MRFVFVISKLGQTGPSGSRIRLAQGLTARGHEVRILTFSAQCDREIPAGVVVETIDAPAEGQPGGHWGHLRVAASLRRWMKGQPPLDFLSTSLTVTDRVARLAGIRNAHQWIHIATSRLAAGGSRKRQARRRRLFRRLYGGGRVIGVSQGVIDDLATLDAHPREADLVYNGFDAPRLRTLATEPVPDLPAGPFVIHVGRFAKAKRHDVLFESFRRAEIAHRLVLLTESRPELTALIEHYGLQDRVIVAGFRQNPYPFMAGAAALVLSSDREGFPNVLIESLVVGTPVISTDCPHGPGEILTGPYARWLSPSGDAERLAANLKAVVAKPYAIRPWLHERYTLDLALDHLEAIAARGPRPTLGRRRLFE